MVSPMVTAAIRREIIRMTVAIISASVTGHPPFAFVVHERDEKPSAICCPSAHIFVNRAEQFCNAFVGAASSGPRAAGSLSRGAETRACPAQTRTRLFLHGRGRSPAAAVDQFGGPKRRLRRRKKTRAAIRQTRAVPPPSCGRRFLVPDFRFPQKAAEPPAGLYRRTALRRLGLDDCGICRACR